VSDVSVVVPTLDEEDRVRGALRSAREAFGSRAELIVVDGGSRDRTRERAAARARVLEAGPGRGTQLDAGGRAARGEILVFLHADTRLERGSGSEVRRTLARPGVVAGCYRFSVDAPRGRTRYRLLEAGVRLRTRIFRTATGDQTIFCTREAFEAAGGIPHVPLFEDVEFLRRLRRLGRFQPIEAAARTSPRRWEERGFWGTVVLHWLLRAAHAAGVSPERLGRWYGATGSRSAG